MKIDDKLKAHFDRVIDDFDGRYNDDAGKKESGECGSVKPFERKRWAVLRHNSGRVAIVDLFQKRLAKMQRRLGTWAQLVDGWRMANSSTLVMITLTYRRKGDWKAGDIREYLNRLRGMLKENLLAWAWVAELQKRGAVHYHMMVLVRDNTRIPKPDTHGHWVHGMSRIEKARSPFYLVTYVGKERQKDLSKYPKGCRLYAASIRFGGSAMKDLFRVKSGIAEETALRQLKGEWNFEGVSVTKGYARAVIAYPDDDKELVAADARATLERLREVGKGPAGIFHK